MHHAHERQAHEDLVADHLGGPAQASPRSEYLLFEAQAPKTTL